MQPTKQYKIVTFGCQMNVHESEKIAGVLRSLNYAEAETETEADIIVFNTCCIRQTAETRALGRIATAKTLKKSNKNLVIALVGCLPQQPGKANEIAKKLPFIDIILGTSNLNELATAIEKHTKYVSISENENPQIDEALKAFRKQKDSASVNIMYGCNNFCTYCIVPYVRGRERSRKLEVVLAEVKDLLSAGCKKITLLGQNVNSYAYGFSTLLEKISDLEGDFSVNFMTSHPKDLDSKTIEVISKSDKLSHEIHLPVQSGSNKVLAAMNRGYTRERYLETVDEIYRKIPDAKITTDIMVGFPTETENDFLDTLDLVSRVRFFNAFTFIYSQRKCTPAAEMEQIPCAIKQRRISELIKEVKRCQTV